MSPQNDTNQDKSLGSFCQDISSFKTRFAQLSFYGLRYSPITEKVLLTLEYLQLMSIILLLHPIIYEHLPSNEHVIFKGAIYFFKLINPSYLIRYDEYDTLVSIALTFVFGVMIAKYLLGLYIYFLAIRNLRGVTFLIEVWRWVFKLQGRVGCIFFSSFWAKTLLEKSDSDEFSFFGMGKGAAFLISILMITFEYSFTFALETQFWYILPTHNYLSAKNNRTVLITLSQKCLLQVLALVIQMDSLAPAFTLSGICLAFDFLRNYDYYTLLPLYQLKALCYQARLLSVTIALNLSYFIQTFLRTNGSNFPGAGINFIIITWIILSIGAQKISSEALLSLLSRLLMISTRGSAEFLLHKVCAMKQLERLRKNRQDPGAKAHFAYLLNMTKNINLKKVFTLNKKKLKVSEDLEDLGGKGTQNREEAFLQFLENLSQKFPRNPLIQLHIAFECSKSMQFYPKAIRIASEFEAKRWSTSYLTASLMLAQISRFIKENRKYGENPLDLGTYLSSQVFFDNIKQEMAAQVDQTTLVCRNIVEEESNIGQIFACSQEIEKSKRKIDRKIKIEFKKYPEYFTQPLLVFAEYSMVMNFSKEECDKFVDLYYSRLNKFNSAFKEPALTEENLYGENTAFVLFSGHKKENGKVYYHSNTFKNVYGGTGLTHISNIFCPSLRPYAVDYFRQIFETSSVNHLNGISRTFLSRKDGTIFEAEMYAWVHPFMTHNLYLNMLFRPIPSMKEFILLRSDGEIEGVTRNLSSLLNPHRASRLSSLNIRQFSEELSEINEAITVVLHSQQQNNNSSHKNQGKEADDNSFQSSLTRRDGPSSSNLKRKFTYQQAHEIFTNLTSEGKTIELLPPPELNTRSSIGGYARHPISFHCKIELLPYQNLTMRILHLTEISKASSRVKSQAMRNPMAQFRLTFDEQSTNRADIDDKASENFEFSLIEKEIETQWKKEVLSSTDRNLLSPLSPASSMRQFLFPTDLAKTATDQNFLKSTEQQLSPCSETSLEESRTNEWKAKMTAKEHQHQHHEVINDNSSSYNSGSKRSFNSFKHAINTRSSPQSFMLFTVLFYLVILVTFVSQFILKFVTDNTLTSLVAHKNLLKYAQLRTYRETMLAIRTRSHVLSIDGLLSTGNLGGAGQDFVASLLGLNNHSIELGNYSQQILTGVSSLDYHVQEKLFATDVITYGTYQNSSDKTPKNLTNFQAVTEIINACRVGYALAYEAPVSQENMEANRYVVQNSVNWLLVKEDSIIQLFLDSLNGKKGSFKDIILVCFVVTPVLLVAVAAILILIIWNQYKNERNLLLAFIKLQPNAVNEMINSLKKFKKTLTSVDYLPNKQAEVPKHLQAANSKILSYQKQERSQVIKYKDILRRYWSDTVKVLVYISILIAIMVYNFVSATNSTNDIYNKQDQLYYSGFLGSVIPLYYSATIETFSTNNTNYVKGRPPLEKFISGIEEIKKIRNEVAGKLLNNDGSYDPQVQKILFQDEGCAYWNTTEQYRNYCNTLVKIGYKLNFLPLLSVYEDLLRLKMTHYEAANKQIQSQLTSAVYSRLGEVLATFGILTAEAQLMSDVIDATLESIIVDAQNERTVILVIFSVSLVLINILFWLQILRKLKEGNNDFKKVLQVLPPNLVLSSFLLKSFLAKTSKDITNIHKLYQQ